MNISNIFTHKILLRNKLCASVGAFICRPFIISAALLFLSENWMKLLACASYDYMKLMVVELQQQIAEVEARLARLAAAAADQNGGVAEPKAPPRTRHNPFNASAAGKENVMPRYTWQDLHQACGKRVVQHR